LIVYKDNKGFEQRSDKPNENWTDNENVYIVPDDSELAEKIKKAYPYYNFITDESGDLIDIEVLEKPIAELKPTLEEEVEELKQLVADLASLVLGV
jgi:hypothetical protein